MRGLPFGSPQDTEKIFFSPVESFIPLRAAHAGESTGSNAGRPHEAVTTTDQSEADAIMRLRTMAKKYKVARVPERIWYR